VLAPARQVVRRPVVQMVGSRHSSLSEPSTTVTASTPPWSWAPVTSPAGHPTSHASASGVTSSGTDQSGSSRVVDSPGTPPAGSVTLPVGGPADGRGGSVAGRGRWVAEWVARRMVRSTRAASDQGGPVGSDQGGPVGSDRMGPVAGGGTVVSVVRMRLSLG
jgi:hypothetical protein